MTQAAALAQYGSTGVSQGFKNRIINGNMVIDQRNAGASVSVSSNTYTLDRYRNLRSGSGATGVYSVQQSSTAPAGFSNSMIMTVTTIDSAPASTVFYSLRQSIEGFNIADLNWGTANAKTVTLSFWVRSSLTGTFGGALNNDTDLSYPFSYTISAANTWEQKLITIVGPTTGTWLTNNGIGINVEIALGVGSSRAGTAGAWTANGGLFSSTGATNVMATNGATFYITGVQLEVGSTATSFDYRPYGTELALCQRYYFDSGSSAIGFFGMPIIAAPQFAQGLGVFAVAMRAAPTVTFKSNSPEQSSIGAAASTADLINVQNFGRASRNSGNWSTNGTPVNGAFTASIEL